MPFGLDRFVDVTMENCSNKLSKDIILAVCVEDLLCC